MQEILQLVRHYDTIDDAFYELCEYNFSQSDNLKIRAAAIRLL